MQSGSHIYKTRNVAQTLLQFAKDHKIGSRLVDFKLLRYKTLVKTSGKEGYEELTSGQQNSLQDKTLLLDAQYELAQEYEIEVYKKPSASKLPAIKIGANADKSKVVFVIDDHTRLRYSKKLERFMRVGIKKQMLLHGYLIGVFDLKKPLEEFFDVLEGTGVMHYAHRQYIPVARAVSKLPPEDDRLEFLYKHDSHLQRQDRKDYSKREFSFGVQKGERIIVYHKPKPGSPGRSCKGEFLPVEEPGSEHFPDFTFNEDVIEKKEDEDVIEYFAKKSGYVTTEQNHYDIEQYVEVENIDFKTTGDVHLGITGDTRVIVTGNSDLHDSVGQGMHVKAKEINIQSGTVGSGALIEAGQVNVQSITHQNSKIYAPDISINVHNGYAKAQTAYIKRLEGGEIEAADVNVELAVGGIIKADEVHVDTLTSNTLIYASRLIDIGTLKGEDNEFIIEPRLIKGLSEEIHSLQSQRDRLMHARANLKKELSAKVRSLRAGESVIKQIKQTIAANEKKGIKTPASYIQRMQKFQSLLKSVRVDEEEMMFLNEELNRLKARIDVKQSIVLNAKVVNKHKWSGYNKVSFSLLSPEIVEETTTEGKKNVIMLKEGSDSRYHIESMDLHEDANGETQSDVSRETSNDAQDQKKDPAPES